MVLVTYRVFCCWLYSAIIGEEDRGIEVLAVSWGILFVMGKGRGRSTRCE
jgi:hypothetical protein